MDVIADVGDRGAAHLTVLTIPGWNGSGPGHWQTLWEHARPEVRRVEQADWAAPVLGDWAAALERAVRAAPTPAILVAHSLGCALVAHWARAGSVARVAGALLVAPADIDAIGHPALRSFAPVPVEPLPFPAWVVASRDDPYARFGRVEGFARAWGARLLDAGRSGHLNVQSGHGAWPEGAAWLAALEREVAVAPAAGRPAAPRAELRQAAVAGGGGGRP